VNHADVAQVSRLVARAKGGDREAFDGLVEFYAPHLFSVALRIVGSREEAEDCVQEAFVRAFASLRSFRGESAFSTWLYRVTVNVANDAAKRSARHPALASELAGPDPDQGPADLERVAEASGATQAGPAELALARRRREVVLEAIRLLPDHQREVVILYDLQGLSYEEIARITRARIGTVKSRLNRARLALREKLLPHLELLRD